MKCVGKIKEAHSLKGELYVIIFSGETSWLQEIENVYFGPLDAKAPHGDSTKSHGQQQEMKKFKVLKFKPHKKGIILKVDGIVDRTAAEKIEGQGLYVEEDTFISKPGETVYLGELLGFELIDQNNISYGPVLDFLSNGPQDLLVIKKNGQEFLVPFVAPFILKIDHEQKKLLMTLPEGLFEP
jgi:16S rRNA processing protein RimM